MDRGDLTRLLGPFPARCPFDAVRLGAVDCGSYVRETIEYAVEADEPIKCFVLVPKHIDRTVPAIFAHHQHASQFHLGKSEVVGLEGDPNQAYASELAERGYVVIAPDALGFEERNWSNPHGYAEYFELATRLVQGKTFTLDSFLLDRLEIPDERRDLRSGSFLDFGRRLVRLRYLSVPVAPDWHFSLTMSSNNATPNNDVGYFIGWECAPVGLAIFVRSAGASLEGFGQSPITMPVDAVAGHARKFIFDNSEMGVFGFRFHATCKLEHEGNRKCCVNSQSRFRLCSRPFHEVLLIASSGESVGDLVVLG
jgi:hypothetical protein